MGQQIKNMGITPESLRQFTRMLLKDIKALELMLERGMIESGVERIGAEQELCLVNRDWCPAPMNMKILEKIDDPRIVTEYARFNLEINLDPLPFTGDCLNRLEYQLREELAIIAEAAREFNVDPILVGILPTIRQRDLTSENMTPLPRYRTLDENLTKLRGGQPFRLSINGTDELITEHRSSLLESCNTSFQVHLQVSPEEFAEKYNFAQFINAPLLAASTNSALLFGRRLWRETRIALFQQSIDTRQTPHAVREQTPRVTFGKGWLEGCVTEIFKDDLARFRMIMHPGVEEDAIELLDSGKIPKLKALCFFNGTVYRWNRACYGILEGKPHLRIENRILPSGPTVSDEIANTAFWLGLMKGMPDEYRNIHRNIGYDLAQFNFFKAARMGLDSQFFWTNGKVVSAQDLILKELLPMAREGLEGANVDGNDIDRFLGIIRERVTHRHTGGLWMFESFNNLLREGTRFEAATAITANMVRNQAEGKPVHEWPLAEMRCAVSWRKKYWRVDEVMSTDLYTVTEGDLVDLAAHIMDWKHIRHVPVEDEDGRLVGMINARTILHHLVRSDLDVKPMAVREIMIKNPITISPETRTLEALKLLEKHQVSCLPVVEDNRLVGMITEYDFTKITSKLLNELSGK